MFELLVSVNRRITHFFQNEKMELYEINLCIFKNHLNNFYDHKCMKKAGVFIEQQNSLLCSLSSH